MMTKTRFLFCALLVLAVVVCSPAFAARYQQALDPTQWKDVDGVCTYDRSAAWWYRSDGLDVEELTGAQPPQGSDPRISQRIENASGDIWTDWHVLIVNGSNLRLVSVHKVEFDSAAWVIDPLEGGAMGFFAHVTSAGPGNPMAINPGETLYVEFTYDALPGPVTVTQYPTTWYPIPEPASIMALLAGMGAFGFSAIRRIKN